MPVLAFHFPWRRYHATPWGQYVNEGAVELPPSPWRLLRSLYSVWKMRAPYLDEEAVHEVLRTLAVPPTYLLPPYRLSHTRHYYPDTNRKSGTGGNTDKAIDAFAVLDGDATIYAVWPGELDDEPAAALKQLAKSLPYLGRADSLCDARMLTAPPDADGHGYAIPLDLDAESDGDTGTGLLAPELPLDITALTARPVEVRAAKLRYPPGSRLVPYAVPDVASARRGVSHPRPARNVTAVRFAITAPARPPVTQAVTLADAFRGACVKALSKRRTEPGASLLVGKDATGIALKGHGHAHFVPIDTNGDRRIDEVIVWAPGVLSDDELAALADVARCAIGTPEGVRGPKNVQARISAYGDDAILPDDLRATAKRWTSVTPFVPNRHRKKGQDLDAFLTDVVTRELGFRGKPAARVNITGEDCSRFTRHRWTGRHSLADARPGYGLRLEFDQPTTGPLALGGLSHFGLGLFRAEDHR